MPKTRKSLLPRNLASYDVYIEDRSVSSPYFQITNLPSVFTGGRNSFLLGGSSLLQDKSDILIEILDSRGKPIYQTPIKGYTESRSKLISVEIYDNTPTGFATVIIMGKAVVSSDGTLIPEEWKGKYNVRWVARVLTDTDIKNSSPLRFVNQPELLASETRFKNIYSGSYNTYQASLPVQLSPMLFSSVQNGYGLHAIAPATFSSLHFDGIFTGSITIGGNTKNVYLPITDILNDTTAFSSGYAIPSQSGIIKQLLLQSGSYTTDVNLQSTSVTSSVQLQYTVLDTPIANVPTSFANLRVVNINTVSGEIHKLRVYVKSATDTGTYKIVGDVPLITQELLITASERGNLPVGNTIQTPLIDENWYAGNLAANTSLQSAVYPVSGSAEYYTVPVSGSHTLQINTDVLLNSIRANIPLDGTQFTGSVSSSGYFIGTRRAVQLFSTTEYTLQFDAYYKSTSGSVTLTGNTPQLDIYLLGKSPTIINDDNPLGQRIGRITPVASTQWFESKQLNFTPSLFDNGEVYVRFVATNGFWYLSNISLKPATDTQFAPDEVTILLPNTDYFNQVLEYKVEFFDVNNNSANVSAVSTPTFFTGSAIDLGILP